MRAILATSDIEQFRLTAIGADTCVFATRAEWGRSGQGSRTVLGQSWGSFVPVGYEKRFYDTRRDAASVDADRKLGQVLPGHVPPREIFVCFT